MSAVYLHGQLVVPGLTVDHVGHTHVAAFEFAGGSVDKPVLLGLPMNGLGVEQYDAHLARLELAAFLQRGDQLLVVHVPVPEVPADGGATDALAVGDDVLALVLAGHRAVREVNIARPCVFMARNA